MYSRVGGYSDIYYQTKEICQRFCYTEVVIPLTSLVVHVLLISYYKITYNIPNILLGLQGMIIFIND